MSTSTSTSTDSDKTISFIFSNLRQAVSNEAYEKAALACEDLEHLTGNEGNSIILECARRIRALKASNV